MGNMAYDTGSIFAACQEFEFRSSGSLQSSLFELTRIACLGQGPLREHLGISVSQDLSARILAEKVITANEAACMLCGLASHIVHHFFMYASDRKIMGRPLVEYQLTLAKLADLATLEAVLCERHQALVSGAFDPENISEISRAFLRISALSTEMLAGSGFVEESSTHDLALSLNRQLMEESHVLQP
jgi:hypothetical protein